jgi:hypothetical protein
VNNNGLGQHVALNRLIYPELIEAKKVLNGNLKMNSMKFKEVIKMSEISSGTKKKFGKGLSILICMLLFLLLSAQGASAAVMGDVNGDGSVNVKDVVLVQKHILAIQSLTDAQKLVADVNGDTKIDANDAVLLMKYTLGLISEFPIGNLQVVSLKALNAKTIGVEFNKVPSATEKTAVEITVKNAALTVIPTKATWDGKTAKVTRTTDLNFVAGTYTVEVKGITPVFNGSVTLTAPTATSLDIKATSIPNDTQKAPLRVELLDQYGEEMPLSLAAFNYTAFNLSMGTTVTGKINFDPDAKFVIDTKIPPLPTLPSFYVGNQVQITFLHIASGLNKTVTLPVTLPLQLGSITLGDPVLPAGATVIFKDFTNIRIPVTAKDQNGDPLFLVKGANVDLFSSNIAIIDNADLTFVTVDSKQYINIAKFNADGSVNVIVMGTPGGVVGSKTLNIVTPVPTAIQVSQMPETKLIPDENTTVKFDIIDQFGGKITVNVPDYKVWISKTQGNTVLVAPLNNADFEIVQVTTGMTITAKNNAALPNADTITFRLQKGATLIDSEAIAFDIIADLDGLGVSLNKTSFTAGENINLTITAKLGAATHTSYSKTGSAVIKLYEDDGVTYTGKFYNRNLTFVNGVASVTVPASLASPPNYKLEVEYKMLDAVSEAYSVAVGAPSKFVLTSPAALTIEVRQTDAQGNTITTFAGDKILKLTYPVAATPVGVDAEGSITVNFAAGVGTITFGAMPAGTYTVQHNGLTGSIVIP